MSPFSSFSAASLQPPDPVGGVGAALEQIEPRQHAIEFRLRADMGVAVALDQPPAVEDLDGEPIVGGDMVERQPVPALEMR